MAMVVASAVSQIKVLPEPEVIPVGLAVNVAIVGFAPGLEDKPEAPPQPGNPAQTTKLNTSAQRRVLEICTELRCVSTREILPRRFPSQEFFTPIDSLQPATHRVVAEFINSGYAGHDGPRSSHWP